jgi:hypothetical protein
LSEEWKSRRQRREEARELAKEIIRSNKNNTPAAKLDVGWFLALFMALALLLLAPKMGRPITVVVLLAMASCLVHPIAQLSLVRDSASRATRAVRFTGLMVIAVVVIIAFGIYAWPPLPYYRTLSQKEIESFKTALGKAPPGAARIRLGCPQVNEEVCVMAGQFLPLFQRAGWKVEGNSLQRTSVQKPVAGVTIFQHGTGTADPSNPDQGLWTLQSESMVQVTKAFTSLDMIPGRAADATMPEGILGVYFGPAPTP